jgi:predicted aspartyl protease
MKRRYSHDFSPLAPMVEILVSSPTGTEKTMLEGKIDSGADLCAVPEEVIAELDLPPIRSVRAAGFDGAHREVLLYHCALEVAGRRFSHVEALATRRRYAIVGRKVLRTLVVELDGPKATLTIAAGRARNRARPKGS